jgi:hypothetical protein
MHARRFSCLLLGLWLGGGMAMTFIAADSAHTADRILLHHPPAVTSRIGAMGQEEARLLLAYPVMQQARWWLTEWEYAELVLGAAFFLFLLFGTGEGKAVLGFTLGMYGLVLAQRFFALPQMLSLGNLTDFVPAATVLPERNQLTAAQDAFIGIEILKALMGFGLGAYMIARSRRSNHAWD